MKDQGLSGEYTRGGGYGGGFMIQRLDGSGFFMNGTEEEAAFLTAAPAMLAALKVCLKAEQERLKKLKPGAPASTYTEQRIAVVKGAIAQAEGL